jgi:Ring finger domain
MTTTLSILLSVVFFGILGLIMLCFGIGIIQDWIRTCCRDRNDTTNNNTTNTNNTNTLLTGTTLSTTTKSIRKPDRTIQLRTINSNQQQLIGTIIKSSSSLVSTTTNTKPQSYKELTSSSPSSSATSATVPDVETPTNAVTTGTSTTDDHTTSSMIYTTADFGNEMIELDTKEGSTCIICLMEYEVNDTIYRNDPKICTHMFHEDCICTWIQRSCGNIQPECPCCRNPIAFIRIIDESISTNTTTVEEEYIV